MKYRNQDLFPRVCISSKTQGFHWRNPRFIGHCSMQSHFNELLSNGTSEIIDRRHGNPEADHQRVSRAPEKRLAMVVGVILAVLLVATVLMVVLLGFDVR